MEQGAFGVVEKSVECKGGGMRMMRSKRKRLVGVWIVAVQLMWTNFGQLCNVAGSHPPVALTEEQIRNVTVAFKELGEVVKERELGEVVKERELGLWGVHYKDETPRYVTHTNMLDKHVRENPNHMGILYRGETNGYEWFHFMSRNEGQECCRELWNKAMSDMRAKAMQAFLTKDDSGSVGYIVSAPKVYEIADKLRGLLKQKKDEVAKGKKEWEGYAELGPQDMADVPNAFVEGFPTPLESMRMLPLEWFSANHVGRVGGKGLSAGDARILSRWVNGRVAINSRLWRKGHNATLHHWEDARIEAFFYVYQLFFPHPDATAYASHKSLHLYENQLTWTTCYGYNTEKRAYDSEKRVSTVGFLWLINQDEKVGTLAHTLSAIYTQTQRK